MFKKLSNYWDNKWKIALFLKESDIARDIFEFLGEKRGNLLDLGSGTGRDSLFFASSGFEVESFDFSTIALEKLENFASEKGLKVKTILGEIKTYDFGIEKYDYIYACNSLHYFSHKETKEIIEKLKKSLKKGGYVFMRVKSTNDIDFGKGVKLEDNYYENGEELKHFFDVDYMKSLFLDFEIIKLNEIKRKHIKWDFTEFDTYFIDLFAKKL
ncbi:MAG: class I SAM-dependent methyltransferase [Candidatus Gracilibacteria bacterium]